MIEPLILLADDDAWSLGYLEDILAAQGYRIAKASTGDEALSQALELSPDLLLMDVMMPGLDGYAVCRQLRADPRTRTLPVVLITALGGDARIDGLEAGADDLLNKPVRPIELRARVRCLLRLRHLMEERHREELERTRLENELALERVRREEESRRKAFYKEVIYAITNGRLELLERDEFTQKLEGVSFQATLQLDSAVGASQARRLTEEVGQKAHLTEEAIHDLALCVSEAATNVIKHAGSGTLSWAADGERVLVYCADNGPGIDASTLPRATLMKGFSTKISLGFGFSILLELLDKVSLNPGPGGTHLLLEKRLKPTNGVVLSGYPELADFPELADLMPQS